MDSLRGQVAIVTGGGSGIGRAAARMLAAAGARVAVAGRRPEPLAETVREIRAAGGEAEARATDLEDGDAAAALGVWALTRFGRVDVVVNNAGHSSRVRSIRWVGAAEWESVFRVNVEGVYRLVQAVLPDMLQRGAGTIVTVSSMAALTPGLLGGAPYGAAKAAAFTLMRHLNAELRDRGIRACTIVPAEVDTPILAQRPLPPTPEQRATMMGAEDVAAAILFCAAMPQRTLVEQIVLMPTVPRDVSADLAAARRLGAPTGQA